MATRFVRIDLSADARDYRPLAVEPGAAMLDPSSANDTILFKWLGGLVAEPEWEGESVGFYVRDDHGGRLEDAVCQPASDAELEGPLKHDLEMLKERIEKAKPETSTERAIHKILGRTFEELTEDENRGDLDSYFFRYRDVRGNWRLVWCWGFQRVDVEPAPAVVCTDPACGLLFVRRPGGSPKCPSCEALLAAKPLRRTPWKRYFLLLLLLLLLGGGLAYWYLYPGRLIATPETWNGPAGSRIEFDIAKAGLFSRKDVTRQAVAVAADPSVVRFDRFGMTATKPGKTEVRFCLGKLTATITVNVEPRQTPTAKQESPSRATFDDFRAEVTYPQGYTQVVVDGGTMRMYVGESRQLGTNLIVFEEETNISRECDVHPLQPSIVRYNPEIRSLVGQSPGKSNVAFTWRDRLATVTVEVLPALKIDGKLVVEPAEATFAAGQALDMRVLVVGKDGIRLDRTDSALLTSSAPDRVTIRGHRACGMSAGTAEISAILPGMEKSQNARLTVTNNPITALIIEPASLAMSVGDEARLGISGRAACGTHKLFRQPDLNITAGGANPESIRVVGSNQIDAVAPGQAAVDVAWQGKLKSQVPVSVTADTLSGLTIDPPRATIHPGQALVYEVTGLRGGRRRVLGPEDGLKLFCDDTQVAQVLPGMTVAANRPGRTTVVAQLGNRQAVAVLNVTPAGELVGDIVTGVDPGRIATRYVDGSILVDGTRYIHDDDRGWVIVDGDVVTQPALYPAADVVELRFVPEVLRIPTGSPGAGIRVVEVLADGTDGRDVTDDPNLEIDQPQPSGVVTFQKAANAFVPAGPGQTRVAARLGTLTARPLLIQVGEGGAGRLQVFPDPLVLWSGETDTFGSVKIIPGDGLLPFDIDYKVTPLSGESVAVEEGNRLRGLSPGVSQVQVTTIDPTGSFDGLSAVATVEVISADELQIEPAEISLPAGEMTPPISVTARGTDGMPYQVPATLESMDENILAPAGPEFGARFVAKAFGGTQLRAVYRGREAFVDVTITGKRFVDFNTALSEGQQDFGVEIEVLAAASEGPLEYRVYEAGKTPPETWTPNQEHGDEFRRVQLQSPRLKYQPRSARYKLTIEARSLNDKSVQKFPFTFRLKPMIEETDGG